MVEIYADCANIEQMERYASDRRISGFTTNPSILKKAGIINYRAFAKRVLEVVDGKSVSFEVLADDFPTMEAQAREIASWGESVYVKIPITNSRGESSADLIKGLSDLSLNITAVMTIEQVHRVRPYIRPHHIVSVFVGRIMDTGCEPFLLPARPECRMLWASAREIYSVYQAETWGYDIITLTPELIAKLPLLNKDLTEYSLETVKQFHEDGKGIEF